MAWARNGDNAATHPALLAIETDPDWDERLVNEAYGFFQRLVTHSAGHMTDGVIDLGAVILVGGRGRWKALTATCVRSGLLTVQRRGKNPTWRVINDPDLVHIRTRAEIEWEKARKLDTSNPRLIVEVKRRDGDACRYCGVIVQWTARRGGRRGSYDHRPPGVRAQSPNDLVVCCAECNGRRGGHPLEVADRLVPLMAVPSAPFYSDMTVAYLASHGVTVTASDPSQQPASSSRTARSTGAGAHGGAARQQPGSSSRTARSAGAAQEVAGQRPPGSADPAETGSTDRDGTGRVGQGWVGEGAAPPTPAPPPRRRGSRGRGGKGGSR